MRTLTKNQKKLLDRGIIEQKARGKKFGIWWSVDEDENFSGELYKKIDSLNPCEIFYQNVNNYVRER